MTSSAGNRLTFGIYPGSLVGDAARGGPADRPEQIIKALDQLQGSPDRHFVVRAYNGYVDPGDVVQPIPLVTPARYDRYLGPGRMLDLVVQYHSRSGDVDDYCAYIEALVARHGKALTTIQIGEEPNVTGDANLDGAYPRVSDALIAGVHAAKERAHRDGLSGLKVGINSSPLFGPSASFFADLTELGGERFIADLDYIGFDFFPDVFRPIPSDTLASAVHGLLTGHRRDNLIPAGLGHLPLNITEHGWPTGPDRTVERQVEVVRTVVGVIAENAEQLNIVGYTHHTLRDAYTAGDGLFCHFGLMTDDYTPKPAFMVYRDLIESLSR